jgi:small conductance mechanosensitive channel
MRGLDLVLQSLPWWTELQFRVNESITTDRERYYATALSLGLFILLLGAVSLGGQLLKRRVRSDAIRALQGLVVTIGSIALSSLLVGVWGITSTVITSLEFLRIGPVAGVKILLTFIVFVGAFTVSRLTKRSIKYGAGRNLITAHQREVAHHIIQFVVFAPAIIFTIALWDVPVESLFLGAGALGIILGFAARQTLSGALSGFVILFARPFEVGDWISVHDRQGIVTDITLYNTQIRTFNEEHVLVPNDQVTGNEIINYSKTDRLRVTTDVGIDYDVDIGTAAAVAKDAMERCDSVSETPRPDVVRTAFDDSAVVLRLRYWIDRPTIQHKWRAQNEVIETVKDAFEAEGIKIPFPQRELMGRQETGGLQVSEGERERLSDDKRTVTDRKDRSSTESGSASDVSEPVEEDYGGDRSGDPIDEDEDEAATDEATADTVGVSEPVSDAHDHNPDDPMTVDGFERDPDPVREGPEAAEGSDPEDDEER